MTWLIPIVAPIAAAALLIPSRGHLDSADDALVLVFVTVAIASRGNRGAAVLCALISAISFDFFLTVPYQSFRISGNHDLTTEILFVVVGLLVGELAVRGRRHHRDAVEGRLRAESPPQLAERIAGGEEPDFVLMAVASRTTGAPVAAGLPLRLGSAHRRRAPASIPTERSGSTRCAGPPPRPVCRPGRSSFRFGAGARTSARSS